MGTQLLVTTDNGLEYVLLDELRELAPSTSVLRVFSGRLLVQCSASDLANVLRSRIANNVYVVLQIFEGVRTLDDVYRCVKSIDYTELVKPSESFAVRPERIGEHSFTSVDIARVAGQAVIDSYLESLSVRPRVDLDNPDIELYVELNGDTLFVAIKATRTSLHRRGYKVFTHPASLKTTIAAAMIRLSGWRREEGLLDPMCGGGTILIEAALIEKCIETVCFKLSELLSNPAMQRVGFSALRELEKVCEARGCEPLHMGILGIEKSPVYAEGGVINAKFAGVDDVVKVLVGDCRRWIRRCAWIFRELGAEPRVAIFNPPYGVRMRDREAMYKLYRSVLMELERAGFGKAVFITSAIGSAESALRTLKRVEKVERLYTIHGTLPSYIYVVDIG